MIKSFLLSVIATVVIFTLPSIALSDNVSLGSLKGTWRSTTFERVKNIDTENFEMRLKVTTFEDVEMIGTDKRQNPPEVKSVKGRIEENRLILQNQESGTIELSGGQLRITDGKLKNSVVFEKVKE